MRRWLAIAAFVAALLVPPTWGQMRLGVHFGSPGFRPGFGGRGFVFNGGFGFGRNPRFGFSNRNSFFFGHRSRFFFNGAFFSSPAYYPAYGGYYPAYGGYPYPVVVQTAPPSSYYPDEYYERGDLRRDIDVLTGKVDRLREDVDARVPRPPAKAQPEALPRPATVLVFKDKHIEEAKNYAIVGETLWVLDEKRAARIPLSDLDLDATVKLNDERGVEFEIPK
jgi:hypothetical protein